MTPGGATPKMGGATPGGATPMMGGMTPGGSTPIGTPAMGMATPAPGKARMGKDKSNDMSSIPARATSFFDPRFSTPFEIKM